MQARGIETPDLQVYNPTTDPNHMMGRQHGYTSKTEWAAPGGNIENDFDTIEVFANVTDAQTRMELLQALQPPLGDGYDYLTGTAILRLSAKHTPAQAAAMETIFAAAAH